VGPQLVGLRRPRKNSPCSHAARLPFSAGKLFQISRRAGALDALAEYGTEEIPAAVTVLNPAGRDLDREVRNKHAEMKRYQELQKTLHRYPQDACVSGRDQHGETGGGRGSADLFSGNGAPEILGFHAARGRCILLLSREVELKIPAKG
jgi:hypothetical protein